MDSLGSLVGSNQCEGVGKHVSSNERTTIDDLTIYSDDDSEDVTSIPFESPGGTHYWKPKVEDEITPYVNQTFASLKDGVEFYKEYGRKAGFEIRRHTEKKHEDGTIILKHVLCSRAGFNDVKVLANSDEYSDNLKKKRRIVSSRCGCKAKIIFKFSHPVGYVVLSLVEEHSHPLLSGSGRQFLKSNSVMGITHKKLVVDAAKANIGASKTHRFAKELFGGYSNVGATCTEFMNWRRDYKFFIGSRDAQMIIQKFKDKQEICEGFFFDYAVDESGRLTGIFWADVVTCKNYDVFGDVVSFDATYGTNKYNMKFVPFTGIDNHKKCVTFAAGLISKEDIGNFIWVFETFLKCMIREPKCIITDQCPAMKQVVPTVFKQARHRLCMWHIMKKFTQKLSNVVSNMDEFMKRINKLIWSNLIEPSDFEDGWTELIREYNLEKNEWLSELYNIRESWIPSFYRDEPMSGLVRTTSISESENFFFDQFHSNSDTLIEFYLRFESAMESQRNVNAKLNYECSKSMPRLDTPLSVERDAVELYTRTVFYEIQKEIRASCYELNISSLEEQDDRKKFYLKEKRDNGYVFEVSYAYSKNHVQCSCKFFERVGILCRHCFFALNQADILKIPRHLVLNRWTIGAERRHSLEFKELSEHSLASESINTKLNDCWYDFQSCVSLASLDSEKLDFLLSKLKEVKRSMRDADVRSGPQNKNDVMEFFLGSKVPKEITVKTPTEGRNKGCGRRLIGEFEKSVVESKQKSKRLCNLCKKKSFHDKRTCPLKRKDI